MDLFQSPKSLPAMAAGLAGLLDEILCQSCASLCIIHMPASPMAASKASLMKCMCALTAAPITNTKNPIIANLILTIAAYSYLLKQTISTVLVMFIYYIIRGINEYFITINSNFICIKQMCVFKNTFFYIILSHGDFKNIVKLFKFIELLK